MGTRERQSDRQTAEYRQERTRGQTVIEGHVLKDGCAAQLRVESHLLAGDDLWRGRLAAIVGANISNIQ